VFGPDVLCNAEEQVRMIRDNLRVAQSRQKSYADIRRRELSFKVGDYVYLKSVTNEKCEKIQYEGQVSTEIYGTFLDSGETWRSGLSIGTARKFVRCA
jgi:hypothetical protein